MQAQIFITLSSLAVGILAGEAIHLVNCSGQHGYASYVVVRSCPMFAPMHTVVTHLDLTILLVL